jgi:hypothetical protein
MDNCLPVREPLCFSYQAWPAFSGELVVTGVDVNLAMTSQLGLPSKANVELAHHMRWPTCRLVFPL